MKEFEEEPDFGIGMLSRRELEILKWVAWGKTNPEIGMILHISSRTVGKHLEHIYDKLSVETRVSAAVKLMQSLPSAMLTR